MRISDWSSDVCSSDLPYEETRRRGAGYDLRADQAPQDPGPGEGRGSRRDRDGKRSDAGDPRAPRQGPLRACVGTASPGSPPGAGGDDCHGAARPSAPVLRAVQNGRASGRERVVQDVEVVVVAVNL